MLLEHAVEFKDVGVVQVALDLDLVSQLISHLVLLDDLLLDHFQGHKRFAHFVPKMN